jgi:hypothetical protein
VECEWKVELTGITRTWSTSEHLMRRSTSAKLGNVTIPGVINQFVLYYTLNRGDFNGT